MADPDPRGIFVLAGTNGAGKSSVAGRAIEAAGFEFFNPDAVTRQLQERDPALSLNQANSMAWHEMVRLLNRAIDEGLTFVFETTLGGSTITAALQRAMSMGIDVRVWYVGLRSPEEHVDRVRARVATGGHDIPEDRIRVRYNESRLHLIQLMPGLRELWVYDNSATVDLAAGAKAEPLLLLHMERGAIVAGCALAELPQWAKPIVMAALQA